jgi:hypothetical protein
MAVHIAAARKDPGHPLHALIKQIERLLSPTSAEAACAIPEAL